jgi:hypothetical protein
MAELKGRAIMVFKYLFRIIYSYLYNVFWEFFNTFPGFRNSSVMGIYIVQVTSKNVALKIDTQRDEK